MKKGNPDKGPQMQEGKIAFDKGYESNHAYFSPPKEYPGDKERGNRYMERQNEIVGKDSRKLRKQQFSKIA